MEAGITWLLLSHAPFVALFLFSSPVNSNEKAKKNSEINKIPLTFRAIAAIIYTVERGAPR